MNATTTTPSNYITPTKNSPIFTAECDYFGYIDRGRYKEWQVGNGNCTHAGSTFATSFTDAVNALHEWLKENREVIEDYPKSKFTIHVNYGEIDTKRDHVKIHPVYSISAGKAKKFIL